MSNRSKMLRRRQQPNRTLIFDDILTSSELPSEATKSNIFSNDEQFETKNEENESKLVEVRDKIKKRFSICPSNDIKVSKTYGGRAKKPAIDEGPSIFEQIKEEEEDNNNEEEERPVAKKTQKKSNKRESRRRKTDEPITKKGGKGKKKQLSDVSDELPSSIRRFNEDLEKANQYTLQISSGAPNEKWLQFSGTENKSSSVATEPIANTDSHLKSDLKSEVPHLQVTDIEEELIRKSLARVSAPVKQTTESTSTPFSRRPRTLAPIVIENNENELNLSNILPTTPDVDEQPIQDHSVFNSPSIFCLSPELLDSPAIVKFGGDGRRSEQRAAVRRLSVMWKKSSLPAVSKRILDSVAEDQNDYDGSESENEKVNLDGSNFAESQPLVPKTISDEQEQDFSYTGSDLVFSSPRSNGHKNSGLTPFSDQDVTSELSHLDSCPSADGSAAAQATIALSRMSLSDASGSPYFLRGRTHDRSPMEDLLFVCDQKDLFRWNQAFPTKMLNQCKKIGEGVYGEVFRTKNASGESVALKVIPIEGSRLVNDEKQKTFEEIMPEILIAKEMSKLANPSHRCSTPNFVPVLSVALVQGMYPACLLETWDRYDEEKESENDRPDSDIFNDEQLFVVFQFGDGGCDLESFEFKTVKEAYSVVVQVVWALAVAEEELEFEHRDLHIGNILLRRSKHDRVRYRSCGGDVDVVLDNQGIQVYIIDFTNSRLKREGCTIFTDLANDHVLFEGPTDEYQFDIYRMMREENGNDWKAFTAKTNVYWIHYLVRKLIERKRYNGKKLTEKQSKQLRQLEKELLLYGNCQEILGYSEIIDEMLDQYMYLSDEQQDKYWASVTNDYN